MPDPGAGDGGPGGDRRAFWYLRKVPLFSGVPAEHLAELSASLEVREIERRGVVYLPGDPGDTVIFVVGGRVKRSKVTREGKELTLAYLGAGEMLGELCLVDGGRRQEMAEAMNNTIVAMVPAQALRDLLLSDASLALAFASVLIERRRAVEAKLEHVIFRSVQAKLAALLLELGEEYGVACVVGTQIGLKVTHQEMANLIGSTRETVSLTLGEFRKRGLLDVVGRTVVLKDRQGLAAIC